MKQLTLKSSKQFRERNAKIVIRIKVAAEKCECLGHLIKTEWNEHSELERLCLLIDTSTR